MPMNARLMRPKAATGLDPRTIAGLEAWWDAADSASVTLDSGRVSQLNDKSGKARHAANSTSGSTQPTYETAAQNGRNVVRFAAASTQRLTVASSTSTFAFLHQTGPSFIAAVARFGNDANPLAAYGLLGNAPGQANHGIYIAYDDRNANSLSDSINSQIARGASPATANTFNAANSASLATYNNVITPNTYVVQEYVLEGGNATAAQRFRARINGGSELAANNKTGTASTSNASFNLQLGTFGNNTLPLEGDICEILIYSQLPTAAAQAAIRRYLAAKWGVTLV